MYKRQLKIPEHPGLKIPHMGWNSLKIRPEAKLFHGIEDGAYVYFVHSYYLKAEDESIVAASTEYSLSLIHIFYYLGTDGKMAVGTCVIDGQEYQFGQDGKMV